VRIAFRADASNVMGTGHVMRCIALAETLHERGAEVFFVCRDHDGNLLSLLGQRNLQTAVLPRPPNDVRAGDDHAAWVGVSQQLDAEQTIEQLIGRQPDWLILDSYGLGLEWQRMLRSHVGKLMVIDDLTNRPHDCDVLLNQNLIVDARERYRTLVPAGCQMLLGPRFALLRSEFAEARGSLSRRLDRVAHLLLFLGGADPDGVMLKVLAALSEVPMPGVNVTVVAGTANANRDAIERLCAGRASYRVLGSSGEIAKLLAKTDLAIGAGGTSTWERCCLGVPAIAIGIAENQYEVTDTVARAGACLYLGRSADFSPKSFVASLEVMMTNSSLRHSMSRLGMALADGLGCQRVAKTILRKALRVRPARPDDAERVFPWRNAEVTRRHSHDPRPFSLEHHMNWFRSCLADSGRQLLIGEGDDGPLGVLRYDFTQDVAQVSIYLDPMKHGRGYGASLLSAGEEWLRRTNPNIARIRAEVLQENEASLEVFTEAGFDVNGTVLEKSLKPISNASVRMDVLHELPRHPQDGPLNNDA
jgi:UDP-2,4-diacetamido-2,4,6-trideoxy-beta-L-altropyranose hydrolase